MTRFQSFQYAGPVAVIGDIHGQDELLEALLNLPSVENRSILVTGDVGDRGLGTKKVLDLLISRKAFGVLGNHDEWLRNYASKGLFDPFVLSPIMGGKATLESYGIDHHTVTEYRKIPMEHVAWLNSLAMLIDLEVCGTKYWLTHAGVPALSATDPTKPLMPQIATISSEFVFWGNQQPSNMPVVDRPVIMGHIVQREPKDLGHVIAIDTGAGFPGGKLTALLLPERSFVLVSKPRWSIEDEC